MRSSLLIAPRRRVILSVLTSFLRNLIKLLKLRSRQFLRCVARVFTFSG